MKILQVMAGAAHGGAETAFIDMCIALSEAGEQIEVVTRANPLRNTRLEKAGLTVHELPFGPAFDVFTPYRLRKIIEGFKPHIVQTWMSRAAQRTPKWEAGMKIPRYLIVSRLGGYYKVSHFKQSDYFTTITPDIRRHLIEGGIAPERVRHINNFAETEELTRPLRRKDFDTPEDAPLLLALGRLHQAKAFDTLLKSIVNVPEAYLWIAGEGDDRDSLEKLAANLGISNRVRFLGWRDDRAALFDAADIFVFPSRYEPFGTVFVQAWAQKVPLVTTASDGPRQYVQDGQDGLMVAIDDGAALTAALQRVIGDEDLRRRLAENGFRRYQNEFTKEHAIGAYLDFYHEVLGREGLAQIADLTDSTSFQSA